ncbi:MAG TPA: ABC transporter permease subunit [Methanomassiliicoccales archaeon]|nr:ABC transporter permease subunit [Methanomassiliicoccales archaeon]
MRLRWDNVNTIVRKEMAEYRKNRYILLSIILMPLLMCTIMPMIYVIPLTLLSPAPSDQPLDLNIRVEGLLADQQLVNVSISNYRIENVELVNCAIGSCEISNCTMESCVVSYSNITDSQATGSIISHCNIWSSTTIDTINPGSVFLGVESELEKNLKLIVNALLLFILLIPSILPTVIASYSFVGEKLSKSLEPLLATPTTDLELLMGKTMAILLPTVLITWVSAVPMIVIVDLVTEPVLGYFLLPDAIWLVAVLLLAPLFAVLSVLLNVVISSRVTDVRSSQQIGGIIVLPAIAFFIIVLVGLVILSLTNMLLFAAIVLALDAVAFYLAVKTFKREEILVRWR